MRISISLISDLQKVLSRWPLNTSSNTLHDWTKYWSVNRNWPHLISVANTSLGIYVYKYYLLCDNDIVRLTKLIKQLISSIYAVKCVYAKLIYTSSEWYSAGVPKLFKRNWCLKQILVCFRKSEFAVLILKIGVCCFENLCLFQFWK